MKTETDLITLSVKDFFSPRMLKYSLMPFVLTMIVLYVIFFSVAGYGVDQIGAMHIESTQTTIENGIPHTETLNAQLQGNTLVNFLMSYALTSWIVSFLVYAIGGFLVLYLSIFVALIVLGFLTPYVLKEIQSKHYPDIQIIGHSNMLLGITLMLKWTFVMLLLFLVFIPLYFIPIVNLVALNYPLYYFFHKTITYDISSTLCSAEENKKIEFFNGNKIKFRTLALYLISLVPFAIFFGAIFYVIYLGHTYFIELRKIHHSDSVI